MIGRLRRRVSLQEKSRVTDVGGGAAETWATVATVWAAVEERLASEISTAEQTQARVAVTLTLRYRADVTTAHRVVIGARVLAIKAIRDIDGRGRWLELDCREGEPG